MFESTSLGFPVRYMLKSVPMVLLVFSGLALGGCANVASRIVSSRPYQLTRSDDRLVLDIDLTFRESMLNIEEPFAQKRKYVRIELVGDGVADSGGWKKFGYPQDIKANYLYGQTGYALVSPDRSEVRLRLYWQMKNGPMESEVNGDYKLKGHEQMPPDLIIVEPEHLFWTMGKPGDEKVVTVRIGSPAEVRVASVWPETPGFSIRIEPAEDRQTWRLILTPTDTSHRTHSVFSFEAQVDGETRRFSVSGAVM